MKLPVRILASALALALAVPGLLAALSVCAMADCGPAMSAMPPMAAMPAGGHDCCPPAAAAIAADCCAAAFESPAASPKVPEPLVAAGLQPSTVLATVPPGLPPHGRLATPAASRAPLDSLAQGCILRI
jgi:hypothetical protein